MKTIILQVICWAVLFTAALNTIYTITLGGVL